MGWFNRSLLPKDLADANVMAALPVFHEKLVLVGDSLSGKSSIVDRCRLQRSSAATATTAPPVALMILSDTQRATS